MTTSEIINDFWSRYTIADEAEVIEVLTTAYDTVTTAHQAGEQLVLVDLRVFSVLLAIAAMWADNTRASSGT